MATWPKIERKTDDGAIVSMQAPLIISASRSTDIPAFYADWFFNRLKKGYSAWTNPFNGVKSYISYDKTRFIVFWSKNPLPLLKHLDELKKRNIGCYIQYTLNDYEKEQLEQGVPPLQIRIDTFKKMVDTLGKGRVVWRFDPLLLTDDINNDQLLSKIEKIGNQLKGYTEKLVFSYADIAIYSRVRTNLKKNNIHYHEWTEKQMLEFAKQLSQLNLKWEYELTTCGEKINLTQFGIKKNHCIDDNLIIRFAYKDEELMKFMKVKFFPIPTADLFGNYTPIPKHAIILPNNTYATHGDISDNGQRKFCGCIKSKDIGEYNTCIHLCKYCYATSNIETAQANWNRHQHQPESETITGQ